METRVHQINSYKRLKAKDSDFYYTHLRAIALLIRDIHKWFDEFAGKRGVNKEGRKCDYTSEPDSPIHTQMKHREQRHHYDGLIDCIIKFTDKYGQEFKPIIESEAQTHILEDMGYIPNKEEYAEKNFWINWQRKVWNQELKLVRL
jgi:hypothetical protein